MNELVPVERGREWSDAQKRAELIALVIDSVSSVHSKRGYRTGLEIFFAWWQREAPEQNFSRALVQRYRAWLEAQGKTPATINQRLAAVRKLADEASAAGLLSPVLAGAVRAVKGAKQLGVRTGNWLTLEQAEHLLRLPDRTTLRGKRDYALLSLFLAAGLRREELATLAIEKVQQRDNRWCVVDLAGKGKRIRTVAIPDWVKEAVDEWIAGLPEECRSGLLLGKVNKGGRFVGKGMSPSAVYGVVVRYAAALGIRLRPHDLRRTYGKLAHKGGARIEQIQLSYGHASLTTTERYLGIDQDLVDAPCDHLQLKPRPLNGVEKPVASAPPPQPDSHRYTAQLRVLLTVENGGVGEQSGRKPV